MKSIKPLLKLPGGCILVKGLVSNPTFQHPGNLGMSPVSRSYLLYQLTLSPGPAAKPGCGRQTLPGHAGAAALFSPKLQACSSELRLGARWPALLAEWLNLKFLGILSLLVCFFLALEAQMSRSTKKTFC